MATFNVGDRVVTTEVFFGEIMGEKKWATTDVRSHGGGGSVVNGTGYVSAPTVTSTTTTHDQIFVRAPDGREASYNFRNMHLAVRAGHFVSIVSATAPGVQGTQLLAMVNRNTQQVDVMPNGVKALAHTIGSRLWVVSVFFGLTFFLGGAFAKLIGLALVGFGAWSRWRFGQRQSQALAGLDTVVRELQSRPPASAGIAAAAESPALAAAGKTND